MAQVVCPSSLAVPYEYIVHSFLLSALALQNGRLADYRHWEGCVVVNIALLHRREVVFNHLQLTYHLQHHVV